MATYWHIAWDGYQGGDLHCRAELAASGIETPWKWNDADEGFDGDVVCVFPDTPRGRTEADWLWYEHPTYQLLRIDVPADEHDERMTTVEEGYPAARGHIPAAWITHVHAGYAEGVATREGDEY
jgi:hypothetical protein